MAVKNSGLLERAALFIMSIEGFSAKSYKDYKQYSWGYGTKAPGANKVVTKQAAKVELMNYISASLYRLSKALLRPYTQSFMVALLSFDYNLGEGNSAKLVEDWNDGVTPQAIANRANLYINAGGVPNQGLIDRREKEEQLFLV